MDARFKMSGMTSEDGRSITDVRHDERDWIGDKKYWEWRRWEWSIL